MSQQQVNSEGSPRDESTPSYGNYQGGPMYTNYTAGEYGQKLAAPAASKGPSMGFRLGLALGSLVLWIMVFGIVMGILAGINHADSAASIVQSVAILGLFLFTSLVIVLNFFFNRKHV